MSKNIFTMYLKYRIILFLQKNICNFRITVLFIFKFQFLEKIFMFRYICTTANVQITTNNSLHHISNGIYYMFYFCMQSIINKYFAIKFSVYCGESCYWNKIGLSYWIKDHSVGLSYRNEKYSFNHLDHTMFLISHSISFES